VYPHRKRTGLAPSEEWILIRKRQETGPESYQGKGGKFTESDIANGGLGKEVSSEPQKLGGRRSPETRMQRTVGGSVKGRQQLKERNWERKGMALRRTGRNPLYSKLLKEHTKSRDRSRRWQVSKVRSKNSERDTASAADSKFY